MKVATLLLLAAIAGCVQAPPQAMSSAGPAAVPPRFGALAAATTEKEASQHNYTELYERLFLQRQNQSITIFEIGIANGGSLAMWQEHFPQARIVAVDIEPRHQFRQRSRPDAHR